MTRLAVPGPGAGHRACDDEHGNEQEGELARAAVPVSVRTAAASVIRMAVPVIVVPAAARAVGVAPAASVATAATAAATATRLTTVVTQLLWRTRRAALVAASLLAGPFVGSFGL